MTVALTPDLIDQAVGRLAGVATRTPVITSRVLDGQLAASVLCKAESFQRTGSFKFRGAYNAMAAMPDEVRRNGVCAVSSGNHAQAVALSAALLGVPAVVLMPADAPNSKMAAVRGYGAEVVTYDRFSMPQWEAGERLQSERGLPFVNSHDDPLISAGAATATIELLEDAGPIDVLLAPVGGGGGLAGYATVLRARHPETQVIAVEPEESGLLAASLQAGAQVERPVPATIADGMQLTRVGALPFAVLSRTVDEVVGVTDAEIAVAMRLLFERLKLVVEPSGAASLAALLSGKVMGEGRRIGVVLSGGNISPHRFAEIVG